MNRMALLLRALAIAATLLMTAPLVAAPQQPPAPRATLHFDKTIYLSTDVTDAALFVESPGSRGFSTEAIDGTIVVENPGPAVLTINVVTARFKVVYDDGRVVRGGQGIYSFSGNPERYAATYYPVVKPGESHSVRLPVLNCRVESKPCSERVSGSVEVTSASGKAILETPEVTVNFVRDPNATYRGRDIRDNRPIFVAQGSAVQQVRADRLVLVFAFPLNAGPTESEKDAVDKILRRHGLSLSGFFMTSKEPKARVAFLVSGQPSVTDAQSIIADVERQLSGRASAGAINYVPSGNLDSQTIFSEVHADAAAHARLMTQLIDSGDVARTILTDARYKEEVQISHAGSSQETINDPNNWNALYAALSFDQPTDVEINSRSPSVYLGAREGRFPSQPLPVPIAQVEQTAQLTSDIMWEPLVVTVDSDRPEIFAIGQTTNEKAERFGYESEALAALLAARRVTSLAASLHVAAGPPTLLVNYSHEVLDPKAIVATGVAFAPAGNLDNAWRTIPTPSPQPPRPPTALRIATPSGPPSPSPTPPYGGVSADDVLPIAVPDGATRFVIRSEVPEAANAGRIRLSVALAVSSESSSLPSTASVERDLRSLPFVDDVAVEVSHSQPRSIGYQLVLGKADFGLPKKIADRIAALYQVPSSAASFSIAPLANCSALAFNAQKHSLDRALHDAVEQAYAQHKELLHLVLVAALPVQASPVEACDLRAHADALEQASRQGSFSQIVVNAPVRLVFRLGRTAEPR